jgi:hypothetical protein
MEGVKYLVVYRVYFYGNPVFEDAIMEFNRPVTSEKDVEDLKESIRNSLSKNYDKTTVTLINLVKLG